jgi:carbamoyltransferase
MGDLYILGINAYDHDVAACLIKNGEIVVGIEKERVTRVKHASGFYGDTVGYCLKAAGVTLGDIDLVVRNCYMLPVPDMERRLVYSDQPHHLSQLERAQAESFALFLSDSDKVVTCSHHLAHAYGAFAVSPFEEGAVMVVDGVGSYRGDVLEDVPAEDEVHELARESESYYRFEGSQLTTLKKVWMGPSRGILSDEFYTMPGLGALYSRVSTYIFGHWNKCGEVMGLAPFGRPTLEPLLSMKDGKLTVPDWPDGSHDLKHPWLGGSDESWESHEHRPEWEDLAWRVQEDTERVLIARANWLHALTGSKNLCIAGGVGLNCVANRKILESTPFENVWIQPAAGDDGIAIGCAYYGHVALRTQKRTFVMEHAYLGREYDRFDEDEAFRPFFVKAGTQRRKMEDVAKETSRILARNSVIGWFQGRSEFGPRALGNRSILADPRDPKMADRVNAQVKHRQAFRPFAPVVLAEKATEYFEGEAESPFMLLVKRVRPDARSKVPAITHVDGTARVQTVRREHNPRLHALLEAFEARTGVAVLLNTSFNIRGEPIVEDPTDAMECFLYTKLDALVIHDWLITKRYVHKALFPVFRFLSRAHRNLRSEALMERFAMDILDS